LIVQIFADGEDAIADEIRKIINEFQRNGEVENRFISAGTRLKFLCRFEMDNAAFSELPYGHDDDWEEIRHTPESIVQIVEVCRILENLATEASTNIMLDKKILDINGQSVGRAEICEITPWLAKQPPIQTQEQKLEWAIARLEKVTKMVAVEEGKKASATSFEVLYGECIKLIGELKTGRMVDRGLDNNPVRITW
jgi:hypothetical protein